MRRVFLTGRLNSQKKNRLDARIPLATSGGVTMVVVGARKIKNRRGRLLPLYYVCFYFVHYYFCIRQQQPGIVLCCIYSLSLSLLPLFVYAAAS